MRLPNYVTERSAGFDFVREWSARSYGLHFDQATLRRQTQQEPDCRGKKHCGAPFCPMQAAALGRHPER